MPVLPDVPVPARTLPRYMPGREFPPYRFLPGVHPHPQLDPAGHSYAQRSRHESHPDWSIEAWATLSEWLWGVDLFNAFYFWEAHEAWEVLWAGKPRESAPGQLLQGLIQVAAALLKIRLASLAGAASLSQTGVERIRRAAAERQNMLGLDLHRVIDDFVNYFRPLMQRTLPPMDVSVPVLTLSGAPAA
jgi:hypothetical protein